MLGSVTPRRFASMERERIHNDDRFQPGAGPPAVVALLAGSPPVIASNRWPLFHNRVVSRYQRRLIRGCRTLERIRNVHANGCQTR